VSGSLHHGIQFLQKLWRKVSKVTGISNETGGIEDFIIDYTSNECESNNGDDSNTGKEVNDRNTLVNC
jgi:hypothetical protein